MKMLATYKNGNHKVIIFDDGTKIKETIDPNADHLHMTFQKTSTLRLQVIVMQAVSIAMKTAL